MTIREQNRKSRAFDQCQHSAAFWGHNFYPSFTCSYQYKVGNFMVCDPHRIAKAAYGDVSGPVDRKDCLVYSVGSDGIFDFEDAVLRDVSSDCEIHTFDPFPVSYYKGKGAKAPESVLYHAYLVGDVVMENRMGPVPENTPPGKSLPTIVKELGHNGRAIDLFKINCEGCEFETYKSWFGSGVDIRQILVEMHWDHCDIEMASKIFELWNHLQKNGYALFYRNPNIAWDPEAIGANIDFSFIKLAPNFTEV